MNITGSTPAYLRGAKAWSTSTDWNDGALGGKGSTTLEKVEEGSTENGRHITLYFNASKNWTGSTSEENSHTHTFSKATTIGSGEYTRPNSVSCLYLISY